MSELLLAILIVCGTVFMICALPFVAMFMLLLIAWLKGDL